MGLDMYLSARRYLGEFRENPRVDEVLDLGLHMPVAKNVGYKSAEISTTVCYWRKANQIHNWFVEHCQGGEDDCREAYVGHEQLVELRDLCIELLKDRDPKKALDELPPASGFFFGSTDIDDYYWDDIEMTSDALSEILAQPNLDEYSFYYHASW